MSTLTDRPNTALIVIDVQNAVVDAVSHLGITHIDMPLTPERVWRAINRG